MMAVVGRSYKRQYAFTLKAQSSKLKAQSSKLKAQSSKLKSNSNKEFLSYHKKSNRSKYIYSSRFFKYFLEEHL